jgi:hypothetical protein
VRLSAADYAPHQVLTDADALITRDPSPFIARLLPEAQILVTSDHLMSTTQVRPEL